MVFPKSVFNDNWGTGLNKIGMENTKQQALPDKNILRQFLSIVEKYVNVKRVTNGVVLKWKRMKYKVTISWI